MHIERYQRCHSILSFDGIQVMVMDLMMHDAKDDELVNRYEQVECQCELEEYRCVQVVGQVDVVSVVDIAIVKAA